ncbi:MAG: hypothetical protein IH932_01305 [Thaumarchaeota archaeon]|nr:hypothetical protein [Nitrososphaerota archaeon]
MKPLIDADILRYEVGFGAETGWQTEGELPPWPYVEEMLNARIANICIAVGATETPTLYITEGKTFRFDIAKKKPYKGTRKEHKPWHFDNLTVYFKDVLNCEVVTGIEADDAMAIRHMKNQKVAGVMGSYHVPTIICSRDKDLKQLPGPYYSWELGRQPSFGPEVITKEGSLHLSDDNKHLTGTGLPFFYAQVLIGDNSDNIPGLPGCGPVAAYNILEGCPVPRLIDGVIEVYQNYYDADWEEELLEQGRLCWMTRRLHEDGSPVLWELGMEE